MTEYDAAAAVFTRANIVDTLLNLGVFAFVGVLVWLHTKAPVRMDD